jgi:cell division transport system permease protein
VENQVTVFLDPTVPEEQKRTIDSALRRLPSVEEVRFESRQEAYARFKELFKDAPDLVSSVKPDSLPESFRVTLKTASGVCEVVRRISGLPGVDQVVDPVAYRRSC